MSLSIIQKAVMEELVCRSRLIQGTGTNSGDNIYILIVNDGWQGMKPNDFYIETAGAEAGAWSVVGTGSIWDDKVVIELRTVHGIMTSRSEQDCFTFYACVPGFPDNIIPFLERAIINFCRARKLHTKRCGRRRRKLTANSTQ